jgi:small subunit ribosomal protein S6
MSVYELAVLYHPDFEVDLTKAEEKVTKIITGNGGKVTETDNWGKKKLAYQISKQSSAVYVFYTVELEPEKVAKVESMLNITDEVMRYLIFKPDLKAKAKAEEEQKVKAERASARSEEEDQEQEESDKES